MADAANRRLIDSLRVWECVLLGAIPLPCIDLRQRLKLIAELQPAWKLTPGVLGADRPRPASLLQH